MNINSLYWTDGYKPSHKPMLAPNTTRLYGTWIPRSVKHAPQGITKIVSFGQQLVMRWLHDEFKNNFFALPKDEAMQFGKDMEMYLGLPFDASHFGALHDLGYLPIEIQALPEGIETSPNIPHMTFINTVDGFAWLTLYLETIISSLAWKPSTSATIALHYRRQCTEWVMKTDPDNAWLIPFLCHDFSARGLNPHDTISSGLGHATSFRGSDSLPVIPAARYYYGEPKDEVCINSVNASEHSVSTTKIFTVGEQQMISDWLKIFPTGILSVVSDTFDLWKLITEYLPALKEEIIGRDGKLVIRPDSGDPVDIVCGRELTPDEHVDFIQSADPNEIKHLINIQKGVIELLWDIFGGTINTQGYKVLDSHIGAIYGDSITPARQVEIYKRLEAKGFAATNIVLGVGSFTYQYNTRDTFGFAAKGAWFEVCEDDCLKYNICGVECDTEGEDFCVEACRRKKGYSIYKDPITDDGTKKSLKGFQFVWEDENGEYQVESEVEEHEAYNEDNVLKTIYRNGEFLNQTTLTQVRERLTK